MGKNKQKKLISIIISFLVVMSLISLKNFNVKANEELTKPTFEISNLTANLNRARIGEDIIVSGQLVPQDFEKKIKSKEIVLVLDTSKSMNDKISVNGVETTKIEELRKSAIEFVDKMKDVNDLKISIITYGSTATINTLAGTKTSLIPVNEDNIENIKTVINNITPDGGTNIGEGLRQALYLLNNSKEADKTIVLMSDALPTYCTVSSKNPVEYYLDTTKELGGATWNSGSGSSDVYGYDLNYAKEVGKLVNSSKIKVFTIGYGLQDEGLKKFKEIHSVMSGLSPEQCNEENGFYSKSDGFIDGIFDKVGNKIIENYLLEESQLNLNINEVKFNFNDKVINIKDIEYKREFTKNTGKIIYHAEPIDFSFTVRGTEVGVNQQVLNRIDINFKFENENISESRTVDVRVDIIEDDLPNITAKLISDKIVSIEENEEFTLKYEINPESFSFNNENSSVKSEVVFVIDVSKDMSSYMNPLMNDLWNDILNNDKLKEAKTEYNIITFSNNVQKSTDLNSSKYSNYDDYISDLNNNCIKEFLKADNSNAKNIEKTYKKIVELLDKGKPEAKKNIVFISETSNISYGDKEAYGVLKDKGYNIITVEIENLENSNNKNDLRDFHKALNGNFDNYFYCIDQNELQNNILAEVAKSIISNAGYNDYIFNPVLKIDLGKSFEGVSGIDTIDNNIIKIKIPEIKYKYSETNNKYNADKFTIEFTLKPKSGEIGELNFGIDNKLVYKKLIKNEEKYSLIETPTVIVKQNINNLTHGLYNGINNGEVIIQENNGGEVFKIAKGSTVTFGANFTFSGMSTNFELNIDNNLSVEDGAIKVYRLINNKLEEVKNDIIYKGNNEYEISILGFEEATSIDKNILIVYRGTVGDIEKSDMKNTITVSNISKDVNMSTKTSDEGPRLPDLF